MDGARKGTSRVTKTASILCDGGCLSLRLPTVRAVLEALRAEDALDAFVVCTPCAEARGIRQEDRAPWATSGGADDLARQAAGHDTTMMF
ncbi:hypothetical protein [Salinibacter sp.]|uniref:hypothetical protein n=1 Tax=Salinibacter sp. TaxID=2065818 RepID=UPI0021E85975|nr:hypothetical protein [Salinibacter sp.]